MKVIDSIDISDTENSDKWRDILDENHKMVEFVQKWIDAGYSLLYKPSKQNLNLYDGVLVVKSEKSKPKNWPIGYYKNK